MAIVAGIDEAGFGPVVGPLVVSACVFRVGDGDVHECLWRMLAGAVTRKAVRKYSALPVADSKALYDRQAGLLHLERGVLGMLGQMGPAPASLREFLRRLCPEALGQMQGYPWYGQADLPLPRQADATDIFLRANAVAESMARRGIELAAMRVECVLEGRYNQLLRATRNKAVALLGVVGQLVYWVFRNYVDAAPARIIVDRLGGRVRYLPVLLRMFGQARIKVVEESERRSAYVVRDGAKAAEISFVVNGEDAALPVALASMASKYTRELLMELLNAWWAGRIADLKPTAGYLPDGWRFLKDIEPYAAANGIDKSLLVRCR